MVLPNWAAEFDAVITHEIDFVRVLQIARRLPRHGSGGLQASRSVEISAGAFEIVRSTLGHHIELHTRSHNAGIGSASGDLHLLKSVEVVIRGRRAGRAL